jgi:hypothetical protein
MSFWSLCVISLIEFLILSWRYFIEKLLVWFILPDRWIQGKYLLLNRSIIVSFIYKLIIFLDWWLNQSMHLLLLIILVVNLIIKLRLHYLERIILVNLVIRTNLVKIIDKKFIFPKVFNFFVIILSIIFLFIILLSNWAKRLV